MPLHRGTVYYARRPSATDLELNASSCIDRRCHLTNNKRLWYNRVMKKKKPSVMSEAAAMLGKKGGKRTLELYGAEHFSKANKARNTRGGGYPKGRPRKPKKDGGTK